MAAKARDLGVDASMLSLLDVGDVRAIIATMRGKRGYPAASTPGEGGTRE
jgi:hypothetical protein